MPAATIDYVRNFLGIAEGVNLPQLSIFLESSKEIIKGEGVSEEHVLFASLQALYVGHMLETSGAITTGKISSKSIADISTSYAVNGNSSFSYVEIYTKIKTQILGLAGRIA